MPVVKRKDLVGLGCSNGMDKKTFWGGAWHTLAYVGHSHCPPGTPSPWGTEAVYFLSEEHLVRSGTGQGQVSWGCGRAGL